MRIDAAIRSGCAAILALLGAAAAQAQNSSDDMRQILERLDRLEQQNRELREEVRGLRQELAAKKSDAAAVEDRVAVQETRTSELAQTKVEAASRFPIRITGMALFNTFLNTRTSGDTQYPTEAAPYGVRSAGATMRQTTLGLEYRGPLTLAGGKVRGTLFMDFFGGSLRELDQTMRFRTATIGIDWNSRSVEAGIEKPLIAQRDPDSLAQVGVSPLTAAGNLWLWIPQIRFEQRLRLGEHTELRAQAAAVQTSEGSPYTSPGDSGYETRRPGIEGRVQLAHGNEHRIEIAPGFHRSVTHAAGTAIPSNIFSIDWLARPASRFELTGVFFAGRNASTLGTGIYRQGYTVVRPGYAKPVRSLGGWAQWKVRATPRLDFHFFTGQQDDRNEDLPFGGTAKNIAFGANFFYRLAPNVLASFEAAQVRTLYIGMPGQINNHYDLGLAYLF